MNLLIVTRKVDKDDERMGFFWVWIEKFAQKVGKLYVICLEKGDTSQLPANVAVYSMGKEKGYGRLKKYLYYRKHLKHLLPLVDGVFVHMIPLYAIAAGHLVRQQKKPMYLWYVHKSTELLDKAEKYVAGFVTASKESFRFKTKKSVIVTGHGIDVERFKIKDLRLKNKEEGFSILTVGRIAPAKKLEDLIAATQLLVTRYSLRITCAIVGAPALRQDEKYLKKLKQLVANKELDDTVEFAGPRPHDDLPAMFQAADVFVNFSATGSVDKTPLEAMACGTPVLTSNEAYKPILKKHPELLVKPGDIEDLAEKLVKIEKLSDKKKTQLGSELRQLVVENHNLDTTLDKIVNLYK